MTDPHPTPDLLLAHAGFARALSRRLVTDEQRAEELSQDSLLALLRSPPRSAAAVRAWLASAVRNAAANFARGERRRADREERGARPERVDSALELVQRMELAQRLLGALGELPEAYRAALHLRFYEDLPPREVAARLGVPVETARSRVRRGIELLRERLDREHGGERGAWVAALLPLTGGRARGGGGVAPPWGAALLPLGKAAAVLACAAAAAALLGVWPLPRGGRGAASPGSAADAEIAAAREARLAHESRAPRREHALAPATSLPASAETLAAHAARLSGRVADARTGEPVPEIALVLAPASGAPVEVVTDAAGCFTTHSALALGRIEVRLLDGPDRLAVAVAPAAFEHGGAPHELLAEIGPTFRLAGSLPGGVPRDEWIFWLRQVGSRSNGGGDWRVHLRGAAEPFARLPAMPRLSLLEGGARSRFAVGAYSGDRRWLGEAEVDARPGVHSEPLELAWAECGRIRGTLRDSSNEPLAGEIVELRSAPGAAAVLHARTGAGGDFALGPVRPGAWFCAARAPRHAELALPVSVAAGEELALPMSLVMLPGASVEGRLTSASGRHVPSGAVRLRGAGAPARELSVLPLLRETERGVEATFRFEDVPPGEYVLLPPAGELLPWEPARIELSAPATGIVLRCRDDAPTFDVAFAPRDAATGAPIDSFRGYLVVDFAGAGRARAVQDRDPAPEARPLRAGEVAFAGVPEGYAVHWLIEADGHRALLGDGAALAGTGALRTVEVELERSFCARILAAHESGGAWRPLAGAEIVTAGGAVLGATGGDGTVFLELAFDPGPIEVRLDGWKCIGIGGFAGGRLAKERELHRASMVPAEPGREPPDSGSKAPEPNGPSRP